MIRRFLEACKIALRSLRLNKLRSALTMLGIIIGVYTVIVMISIVSGLKSEIVKQIEALGADTVIVTSGKFDTNNSLSGISQQAASTITDDDVAAIEQLPEVQSTAPIASAFATYKNGDKEVKNILAGRGEAMFQTSVVKVTAGRGLTKADFTEKKKVVVLLPDIVKDLFGDEDPIGKKILIDKDEFEVIGVMELQSSSFFGGSSFSKFGVAPANIVRDKIGQKNYSGLMIKATNKDAAQKLSVDLKPLLEGKHGEEDFTILTQKDIVGTVDTLANTLTLALSLVTAISLVVGGIGIMNIMLVSVTERTREIGIRKAVGATTIDILVQFLIESIVLSLVGGLIGLLLSFLTGQLLQQLANLPTQITPSSILLAVGVSAGIGVVFGLAPAISAARKRPIQALRYE